MSLRVWLVLVLVLGAWLGDQVRRARAQREAVAAIVAMGGRLSYHWTFAGGTQSGAYNPSGTPWAPAWLVDRVGRDDFGRISVLYLDGVVGVEAIPHIARLDRLERLHTGYTDLRGDGMARIAGLTRLEHLDLNTIDPRGLDLSPLESLPRLRELVIPPDLPESQLVHVGRIKSLRALYVMMAAPNISEAAWARLQAERPDLLIQRPIPAGGAVEEGFQ